MTPSLHLNVVSKRLTDMLTAAVANAGEQLSQLTERRIQLHGTHVEQMRLELLPSILQHEDQLVTAIHLSFSGDCDGHVILSFTPRMALHLASIMLMEPEPEDLTLGEMECSVLGEIGNITTSGFLNEVANVCNLTVHPSPPTIVQDMIGALINSVVVEMALEMTDVLLVHSVFFVEGEQVECQLLLLPSDASLATLERQLARL